MHCFKFALFFYHCLGYYFFALTSVHGTPNYAMRGLISGQRHALLDLAYASDLLSLTMVPFVCTSATEWYGYKLLRWV